MPKSKKLYHISFTKVSHFHPRVPRERADGEDSQTPRICFSEKPIYAMNAKPWQGWTLFYAKKAGLPIGFYIYEIDTADQAPESIYEPYEVAKYHNVQDATVWREHWLLQEPVNIKETFVAVKSVSFRTDTEPSKWVFRWKLEETEDEDYHFLEKFAQKASKKLNANITVEKLLEAFATSLKEYFEKMQDKQQPKKKTET